MKRHPGKYQSLKRKPSCRAFVRPAFVALSPGSRFKKRLRMGLYSSPTSPMRTIQHLKAYRSFSALPGFALTRS